MNRGMKRMTSIVISTIAALFITFTASPVHADGYWTEGWWDDATQTWHEGYWTETGSAPAEQAWDGNIAPRGFTYYNQYANPRTQIGEGNMQDNGCVPTAAAMLLSGYGIWVAPEDMGWYLNSTGNFNAWYGHGGTDLCWYDVANYAGLGAWTIYDYDSMVWALQSGSTIAAHIYYGSGSHAVLCTGYSNGSTTVYDPIGGIYTRSVSSIWEARSFIPMDCLSGNSIIAIG